MPQLKMTKSELEEKGFTQKEIDGKICFEREGSVNFSIIYNPEESFYVWYLKTVIGDTANWVHLNVQTENGLIALLVVLRILKSVGE